MVRSDIADDLKFPRLEIKTRDELWEWRRNITAKTIERSPSMSTSVPAKRRVRDNRKDWSGVFRKGLGEFTGSAK
jgi:hypothetical protein